MKKEYDDHADGIIMHYIAANGLKYGGLICGIAGVVGENPSVSKVTAGCLGFLVGTMWDRSATRVQSIRELKVLEQKLKGEPEETTQEDKINYSRDPDEKSKSPREDFKETLKKVETAAEEAGKGEQ